MMRSWLDVQPIMIAIVICVGFWYELTNVLVVARLKMCDVVVSGGDDGWAMMWWLINMRWWGYLDLWGWEWRCRRVCRRGRYSRRTWISCLFRRITEYLFRLPSYNEADLFLGLSVFGVENRIGYELAQFFLITLILLLQPNQFSVL